MMPSLLRLLFAVAVSSLSSAGAIAAVPDTDGTAILDTIAERAQAATAAYEPAQGVVTATALSSLYFDEFENLELDLGRRDPTLKTELEMRFGALTSSALRGASRADVDRAAARLQDSLAKARALYADGARSGGFGPALLESLLILLREGIEAILILSALSAWLNRSGNGRHLRALHAGALLALLASLLTAWGLNVLVRSSGAAREAIEGVVMLVAAAVLLYVGGWLFSRREGQRWQAAMQRRLADAVDRGGGMWIALAAFLAVYREGAEVALFYQALFAAQAGQDAGLWCGVALAALLLVVLYVAIRELSVRLPLKPFFTATALLLFAMAFVFAGRGLISLQALGWVPATPLAWLPEFPRIGFSGTREGLLLQAAVLCLPLAWLLRRRRGAAAGRGA